MARRVNNETRDVRVPNSNTVAVGARHELAQGVAEPSRNDDLKTDVRVLCKIAYRGLHLLIWFHFEAVARGAKMFRESSIL